MISQGVITPDIEYCRDLIERHDYERYALSMGAKAHLRPALWAVTALYYELAKTPEYATGLAGHIRLTWWRDSILKGEPAHEVLRAVLRFDLPTDLLVEMVESRRADVEGEAITDIAARAGGHNIPLYKLYAHILGIEYDVKALATAYGIVGMARRGVGDANVARLYLQMAPAPTHKVFKMLAALIRLHLRRAGSPRFAQPVPFLGIRILFGSKTG